jgi:hypothetical protein
VHPRAFQEAQHASSAQHTVLSTADLTAFADAVGSKPSEQAQQRWKNTILPQLNHVKPALCAWLRYGEPIAAANSSILVLYSQSFHLESAEKEKQVIEQVLQEHYRRPVKYVGMLQAEWRTFLEERERQRVEAERASHEVTLQLEQAAPTTDSLPEHISAAQELFGDLVVIDETN